MALTWYRHIQRNGGLNQILRRQGQPIWHYVPFRSVCKHVIVMCMAEMHFFWR